MGMLKHQKLDSEQFGHDYHLVMDTNLATRVAWVDKVDSNYWRVVNIIDGSLYYETTMRHSKYRMERFIRQYTSEGGSLSHLDQKIPPWRFKLVGYDKVNSVGEFECNRCKFKMTREGRPPSPPTRCPSCGAEKIEPRGKEVIHDFCPNELPAASCTCYRCGGQMIVLPLKHSMVPFKKLEPAGHYLVVCQNNCEMIDLTTIPDGADQVS